MKQIRIMINKKDFSEPDLFSEFIDNLKSVCGSITYYKGKFDTLSDPDILDVIVTIASLPILSKFLGIIEKIIETKTCKQITIQLQHSLEKYTFKFSGLTGKEFKMVKDWFHAGNDSGENPVSKNGK